MTDEEFWKRVGEQLLLVRSRKGWNPIDVERNGGPNYATVQANERGQIGRMESLTRHAKALQVSAVDLFRHVLQADGSEREIFTPEALQLVHKYRSTTLGGRAALVAVAQELPDADDEAATLPPAPAGTRSTSRPTRVAAPGSNAEARTRKTEAPPRRSRRE